MRGEQRGNEEEMDSAQLMRSLTAVLPYWHYMIDRPFKQAKARGENGEMSLETYYCLQMLRHEGALSMTEIAGRLKFTKQQATRIIGKLIEYDFVRRSSDPRDRRLIVIEITPRAVRYLEENIPQNPGFLRNLERLDSGDAEEFGRALEIMLRILPKL